MSGDYRKPIDEFAVINVMLPSRYHEPWKGNLVEQRAASIAAQLHGEDMRFDYDQLLAKPPGRPAGSFAWHQDQAYFDLEEGSRCVGVWIAMDAADTSNGCMRLLRGRHRDGDGQPVVQAHHQERDWQIADVRPTPSCSALDCSLGSHARAAGRMTSCCRVTSRRCRSSPARSSSLTRSCRTALRPTRTRMAGDDEHCSFTTCSGRRRRSPRSACRRSGG